MTSETLAPRWPFWWGTLGFVALLTNAIIRLTPLALDALAMELEPLHWAALVGYSAFMAYSEGYRGFHRQASPRIVARGLYLARHPTAVRQVLAPLFCMGLFGATRKRMAISWSILFMIVGLIIAVRLLPQPWRGIVDAGVVLGLAMGVVSTLYFLGGAARGRVPAVDPEVG